MVDSNSEFQPPAVIAPQKESIPKSIDSLGEFLIDPDVKALPRLPGILLLFGQGPVVNELTREKASDVSGEHKKADINYWSKEIASSTKALYAAGEATNIIVMGGKTGGDEFPSEAELMQEHILADPRAEVNPTDVLVEDQSTNTLENLINVCNRFLDNPKHPELQDKPIHVVGADYHIGRIQLLMEIFEIPFNQTFSAEAVTRYIAQRYNDTEKLNELDNRLNINTRIDEVIGNAYEETPSANPDETATVNKTPDYFDEQKGTDSTEKKPTLTRLLEEDLWTRFLLSEPAYWVGTLATIQSDERLQKIMNNLSEIIPNWQEMVDIEITDDLDSVRNQLSKVDRTKVKGLKNLAERPEFYNEHVRSGFPNDVAERLQSFVTKRSAKRAALASLE